MSWFDLSVIYDQQRYWASSVLYPVPKNFLNLGRLVKAKSFHLQDQYFSLCYCHFISKPFRKIIYKITLCSKRTFFFYTCTLLSEDSFFRNCFFKCLGLRSKNLELNCFKLYFFILNKLTYFRSFKINIIA